MQAHFPHRGATPRVLDLGFLRLPLDDGMSACWWRTFFPSLSLFLLTAAFVLTKTGRDALYFAEGTAGVFDLPKAYLGIAILSVPAAQGTLALIRWLGPREARVAGLAMMAVLQGLFYVVARPGSDWLMTLIFMLIPLLYGVLLSLGWLLGADLLDLAPRRVLARLYATMGAASMLGGLTGAAMAKTLAPMMNPRLYLLVGVAALALTAIVNALAHRTFPVVHMQAVNDLPLPSTEGGAVPESAHVLPLLFGNRYVALLASIAVLASVAGVLIEFQFYWSAVRDNRSSAATFASFYLWLNGAALALQVFVTPVLQRRVGVPGSLFVLPAAMLGGAALALATASPLARAGLRIAEGGLKSSIHRSNWEQSYLPVERSSRASVKLLVDGMASRTGESLASILLIAGGAMLMEGDFVFRVLLATAALWFALTIWLRVSLRDSKAFEDLRPDLPIPDG